jgi:hypothetical protein
MRRKQIVMLKKKGYNYILHEANRKPTKKRRFFVVRWVLMIINLFKKHD